MGSCRIPVLGSASACRHPTYRMKGCLAHLHIHRWWSGPRSKVWPPVHSRVPLIPLVWLASRSRVRLVNEMEVCSLLWRKVVVEVEMSMRDARIPYPCCCASDTGSCLPCLESWPKSALADLVDLARSSSWPRSFAPPHSTYRR